MGSHFFYNHDIYIHIIGRNIVKLPVEINVRATFHHLSSNVFILIDGMSQFHNIMSYYKNVYVIVVNEMGSH
jgi:hypothetical protein